MATSTESTELIQVESLNAIDLFTAGGVDNIVKQIKEKVEAHVPDLETAKGRSEIASLAYKVARSKTILDGLGKDLVADRKRELAKVDAERKRLRDDLDRLRDYARQPLTAWEEEQKRIEEAKRLQAEKDQAEEEAHAEYALRERERVVRERQAELDRLEAERKAKEEAERLERERKEREERIAKEAEDRARRDAEMALQKEREARERAEREKIEAEARAKAEREAAVREAERKAREEAERKERERLETERKAKEEAERKAANKRHQKKITAEALESAIDAGFEAQVAATIIDAIVAGQIKHVTINY